LQVSPLQYIDVCFNNKCHRALIDSGCEVPLIHSRLLGDSKITSVGSILLQPIDGPSVETKLAAQDISLFDNRVPVPQCNKQPVHIVFAVSDCMIGQEVVLSPSIVNDLQGTNQTVFVNPCTSVSLSSSCLTTIVSEPVNDQVMRKLLRNF
jgi:hypothetical protein